LWVKLTPNTADIVALAKACADNGADALAIINTISGMAIDVRTRRPKIATVFGGLSGPAIKAHRAAHGVPGAQGGGAAAHLGHRRHPGRHRRHRVLPRGRQHVQIGTQSFVDPTPPRIVRDLSARCVADASATSASSSAPLRLTP